MPTALLSWRHEIWSNGHSGGPASSPTVALLAASHRAGGEQIRCGAGTAAGAGGGAGRNAVPGYDFPAYAWSITC